MRERLGADLDGRLKLRAWRRRPGTSGGRARENPWLIAAAAPPRLQTVAAGFGGAGVARVGTAVGSSDPAVGNLAALAGRAGVGHQA